MDCVSPNNLGISKDDFFFVIHEESLIQSYNSETKDPTFLNQLNNGENAAGTKHEEANKTRRKERPSNKNNGLQEKRKPLSLMEL